MPGGSRDGTCERSARSLCRIPQSKSRGTKFPRYHALCGAIRLTLYFCGTLTSNFSPHSITQLPQSLRLVFSFMPREAGTAPASASRARCAAYRSRKANPEEQSFRGIMRHAVLYASLCTFAERSPQTSPRIALPSFPSPSGSFFTLFCYRFTLPHLQISYIFYTRELP